jgi:monoamine oxidase
MTRKEFLSRSAVGLSSIPFLSPSNLISQDSAPKPKPSSPNSKRAVVIGLGLSGLVAANKLREKGYNLYLVEASSRAGGRIHSTSKDQSILEWGGEWISGNHKSILDLLKTLNIKSDVSKLGFFEPLNLSSQAELNKLLNMIKNMSPRQKDSLDKINARDFLKFRDLSDSDIEKLDKSLRPQYGTNLDQISILKCIEDFSHHSSAKHLIEGGSERLIDKLVNGLEGELFFYNSPVNKISYKKSGVTVSLKNGTFLPTCDLCIVSIPSPLWRTIDWDPVLPKEKLFASLQLTYSQIEKFFYWNYDSDSDDFMQNGAGIFDRVYQSSFNGNKGHLQFLSSGSKLDILRNTPISLYPNLLESSFQMIGKSSKNDEYSWLKSPLPQSSHYVGAVSQHSPGVYSIIEPLSRPLQNIYFVGEHLSNEFSGTMNGAVQSADSVISSI